MDLDEPAAGRGPLVVQKSDPLNLWKIYHRSSFDRRVVPCLLEGQNVHGNVQTLVVVVQLDDERVEFLRAWTLEFVCEAY